MKVLFKVNDLKKQLRGMRISHYASFSGSHTVITVSNVSRVDRSETLILIGKNIWDKESKIFINELWLDEMLRNGSKRLYSEIEGCSIYDEYKILETA